MSLTALLLKTLKNHIAYVFQHSFTDHLPTRLCIVPVVIALCYNHLNDETCSSKFVHLKPENTGAENRRLSQFERCYRHLLWRIFPNTEKREYYLTGVLVIMLGHEVDLKT